MQSGSSSDTSHNILDYLDCHKLSRQHLAFTSAITSHTEPTSYTLASKHLKWKEAMQKEIQALPDNNTWVITTLPPTKHPISCK